MNREHIDICEECLCAQDCNNKSCDFFCVEDDIYKYEAEENSFDFFASSSNNGNPLDMMCAEEDKKRAQKLLKNITHLEMKKINEEEILNLLSLPRIEGMGKRLKQRGKTKF